AALWEAHRRREAERLAGLSNGPARPGLARFDTWALRLVPLLALIVAIASAGGGPPDRLLAAVPPRSPPPAASVRKSLDRAAGLYRQAADLSRHGRQGQAF